MGRWDEFWRFVVGGGVLSFWFKVLSISLSDTDKAVVLFPPCRWRFWFGRGRAGVDAEGNPRLCGGLEMWDLQWGSGVSGGRLVVCLHPLNGRLLEPLSRHDIQPPRKGVEVGPFFVRIPLAVYLPMYLLLR